ncbi:MAG: hypothetical protein ACYC6H_08330 [Bellilinea sp.]
MANANSNGFAGGLCPLSKAERDLTVSASWEKHFDPLLRKTYPT